MEKQGEDARDAHVPEHRRPAPRDVHEPRRAVVRPCAASPTPGSAGASRGCSTRTPTAADDRVAARAARSARARCATSCWRTSRRWAATRSAAAQARRLVRSRRRRRRLRAGRGSATMTWAQEPFLSMAINTLPGVDGTVAEGSWFMADPPLAPLPDPRDPRLGDGARQPEHLQPAGRRWSPRPSAAAPSSPRPRTCGPAAFRPSARSTSTRTTRPPPSARPRGRSMRTPAAATACSTSSSRPRCRSGSSTQLGRRRPGAAACRRRRTAGARPGEFNPHDPAFFQNPYPVYAASPRARPGVPVVPVPDHVVLPARRLQGDPRPETETFLKHPPRAVRR